MPAGDRIFLVMSVLTFACTGSVTASGGGGGASSSGGATPVGSGGRAGASGGATGTGGAMAAGGAPGVGGSTGGTPGGGAGVAGAGTGGRSETGGAGGTIPMPADGGSGDAPSAADGAAGDAPPASDGGAGDAAPAGDGGIVDGGVPGTLKIFDQIPQFGMYATSDPTSYVPPAGVLMWNYGSFFVAKLTAAQQTQIGSDLAARITYHAQCDNYDRLASVFFVTEPKGQAPKTGDPRVELVRFITPFSNYNRGALATRVYPNADISMYARTLADTSRDVWVGIGGGSNPYDGDPCTNAGVAPAFRAIGYKFSLEFVSSKPLQAGPNATLTGIYYLPAMAIPVPATINNPGASVAGTVTVIVSGHGSAAGGDEYRYTTDTVRVNGTQVGSFNTMVDCAPFASLSPDGNPGIFQRNTSGNPRNWCPGALVPAHSYPVTLVAGANSVSLAISPADVPSGSYYSTSIAFAAR